MSGKPSLISCPIDAMNNYHQFDGGGNKYGQVEVNQLKMIIGAEKGTQEK